MNFVTRTRVLVLLGLGLALGLLVAALGNAGTNTILFQAVEGPTSLHAGHQGLVFAKFQPSSSSGAATHTVITFTFPSGVVSNPTPDPATSSDCAPTADPLTIACAVGTVNPGQLVKRFITFTGGTAGQVGNISVSVAFDAGSGGAKGGGKVNPPDPIPLTVTTVDGSTADGTCDVGGASIQTAPLSSNNKNIVQQTKLDFGNSATTFPCTWASVGVQPLNGPPPGGGAPAISSVDGPPFGQPASLTLTFSSLPVPVKKFVLKESLVDPSIAKPGDWKVVPFCTDPAAANADTCIVNYDNGNPIVGHLLFRGIGVDPWYD